MHQLLFLIHGMGAGARTADDPAEWWTDVVARLRALAKAHGHAGDLVLANPGPGQTLVVPLTYHDVFDDVRAGWSVDANDRAAWLPLLREVLPGALDTSKLPEWAEAAGDFFWTHVLDVLLYRYVPDVTRPVRDQVALQVTEAWSKADLVNGARTRVHFVAHSLGTAVLHDALCTLFADPDAGAATRRIRTMLTLANVSAVLENGHDPYRSADRPLGAVPGPPAPAGVTEAYISARHELDPITFVRTFRGDLNAWPPDGYHDEVLTDVTDWNVHGYLHYLDNPETHLRLFERLWKSAKWNSGWDSAMRAYRASPGRACPRALARLREDLREVIRRRGSASATDFIECVVETLAAIRRARAACAQEEGP